MNKKNIFQEIFDKNPDGVEILDKDGNIINCNDLYSQMVGYCHEDIIKKHTTSFFSEKSKKMFKLNLKKTIDTGSNNYEVVLNHKSGKIIPILRKENALYDDSGHFKGIIVYNRDISEKNRIDIELRKKEKFNRAIIENAPFAISIRSSTGQLISYNEEWKKMWSIPDEKLKKDTNTKREKLVFNGRDNYLKEWQGKIREIYKKGGSLFIPELKVIKKRKDATEWISQYFYCIEDDDDAVSNVIILSNDITEIKKRELRHLLKATLLSDLRKIPSIDLCLHKACELIKDSELFEKAFITIKSSDGKISNYAFVGYQYEYISDLIAKDSDDIIYSKEYKINNSYFIPEESSSTCKTTTLSGLWKSGDKLIIPLFFIDSSLSGKMIVDSPFDDKRPEKQMIIYLEDIVDIIARHVNKLIIENELELSEKKYKNIVNNSLLGIHITQNQILKFCNRKFAQIFGYDSSEKVIGKKIIEFIASEDRGFVKNEINSQESGNKEFSHYEFKGIKRDLSPVYIEILGTRIFYNGKPAVQGMLNDITERKHIEKRIKALNEIYRSIAETMISSDNVQDVSQKILDGLYPILKYDLAEIYIKPGKEIINIVVNKTLHDDYEIKLDNLQKINPSHLSPAIECIKTNKIIYIKNARKDKLTEYARDLMVEFDINQIYSLPLNLKGKSIGVLQIITSGNKIITSSEREIIETVSKEISAGLEKIIAEKNLHQSEELHRLLVENVNDAIYLTRGKTFDFVNPKFCKITGYTAEEIISSDFSIDNLLSDEMKVFMAERYKKRKNEKKSKDFYQFQLINKKGREKKVEVNTVFLGKEDDRLVLGIMRDITDKLKMEQELIKMEKLETTGVLAGGIAHDFNNILMGIVGNISLAKLHLKRGDEIFNLLTEAEESIVHAKNLTHQLLTFSKGGAPVKENIQIDDLLKKSVTFSLRGSNIKFNFIIDKDICSIKADPTQITQVINNLVINARDAMPEGGTILAKAENTLIDSEDVLPLNPGKYINITIKDHGLGIPEEHIKRIFDPFFTTKHEGSGLGLAVSYSIIKNHDGYIIVYSELGKGTEFHIYLPAFNESKSYKPTSDEIIYTGNGKILVMDDQKIVRDTAAKMIEKLGYQVTLAKDGDEAIESYLKENKSGEPFDLVILDLTIPGGLGGKETVKRLLGIDSNVKVIVSSGYSDDKILSNYRETGFCGVISKPYNLFRLSQIIKEAIESDYNQNI